MKSIASYTIQLSNQVEAIVSVPAENKLLVTERKLFLSSLDLDVLYDPTHKLLGFRVVLADGLERNFAL